MSGYILNSAPNWYCSRVSDCNKRGIVVIGARCSLNLLDVSVDPPRYAGQILAHSERVTGVSLCPHDGRLSRVSTAGEDGLVKIFDLEEKRQIACQDAHKCKVTAVHWSPVDVDLVVSGDEKGGIITWNVGSNEINLISPLPAPVFCLTCCRHDSNIAAVGLKSGVIFVLDLRKRGAIIHKLRGHDEEVHSVVWCPTPGERIKIQEINKNGDESCDSSSSEEDKEGWLLASGSRDRTVRLWSMTRGRSVMTLKLPHNTGFRRSASDDQSKQRVWLTLHWPANRPRHLVSSSYGGEILLWNLCSPNKQRWQAFAQSDSTGHNRIVFNICAADQQSSKLCSISMDRQIALWDAENLECVQNISTLGGFVYSVTQSTVDPGRVAIGTGDNLIRIWNIANPNNVYETQVFWQGIKTKVTSLAWHPVREGVLAYGTEEGRVGIYDVLSNKAPHISSTYHRRTVYVVSWGPPCGLSENKKIVYHVFSCGDGLILQHDPYKLDAEAVDVNEIIAKTNGKTNFPIRSEISWKPDFTGVAVGNDDGSVEIFRNPDWRILCTVNVHSKLVNVIRWHPQFTSESTKDSDLCYCIAIGSNESVVHVVDLRKIFESDNENITLTESLCQLEGHTSRVTGLSWSCHGDGKLVSASYDGTAQVWDVKNQVPVANYRSHQGRLLCVQWSMLDADIIFSGGDDFALHQWKISEQEHVAPPKAKQRGKNKKGKNKHTFHQNGTDAGTAEVVKAKVDRDDPRTNFNTLTAQQSKRTVLASMDWEALLEQRKQEIRREKEERMAQLRRATAEISISDDKSSKGEGSLTGGLKQTMDNQSAPAAHKVPYQDGSALYQPDQELISQDMEEEKKPSALQNKVDKRKRKAKSLFPVSANLENRGKISLYEDCVQLAKTIYDNNSQTNADGSENEEAADGQAHLGLYTGRRGAYHLIQLEEAHHLTQNSMEQFNLLQLWKGDIGSALQHAADNGLLSDWLVSLAPMASYQTWQKMCVAYSKQLESEGSFQKAASYLVASHKIYEALDFLIEHNMFKEAVSLAQVRLSSHDPLIEELLDKWGHRLAADGNYEPAAKCFIALKQPIKAAKLLAKRADQSSLRAAARVCLAANEIEAGCMYALKCITESLQNGNWQEAADIITFSDHLQPYGPYANTHEMLVQQMTIMGCISEDLFPQQQSRVVRNSADDSIKRESTDVVSSFDNLKLEGECQLSWKPKENGEGFLRNCTEIWKKQWKMEDGEQLRNFYDKLLSLVHARQGAPTIKQLSMQISVSVSTGLLALMLGDFHGGCERFLEALSLCYDHGSAEQLNALCSLIMPQGPASLTQLSSQISQKRSDADDTHDEDTRVPVTAEAFSTDTLTFSARDGLQAFHSYCALQKHQTHSNKQDESDQNECNSNDESSLTKMNGASESLSLQTLQRLSCDLLWDVQAEKYARKETLSSIQNAVKNMVTEHKKETQFSKDVNGSSYENTQKNQVESVAKNSLLDSSTSQEKHNSSKEVDNTPAKATHLIPESHVNGKAQQHLSQEAGDSSDAESGSQQQKSDMVGDSASGESIASVMTESSISQTRIYSQAHSIFSDPCTESSQLDNHGDSALNQSNGNLYRADVELNTNSGNSKNRKSNGISNQQRIKTCDPTETEKSEQSDNCDIERLSNHSDNDTRKPDDWSTKPVDERYRADHVTLSFLTAEMERVKQELDDLPELVKEMSFPRPLRSAELVLEVSNHLISSQERKHVVTEVCTWALKHAVLSAQRKWFMDAMKSPD